MPPAKDIDPADPPDAHGSRALVVTERIRDAILDGRLAPGARIRQEELAARFGTSRIPIRDALRQLEAEGLVTLKPNSGAWVARMDYDEYSELYRLREVVEPFAIAESAPNMTDEILERLARLAAELERSTDDLTHWLDLDRRFHLESYSAAPLPRVLAMCEGFWNQTQQYRRAHHSTLEGSRLELAHMEHQLILDALVRRDPQDAEARQRSHIRRTRIMLANHPELFDPR
jgi:DNA-binding GntR family transcriptional regulator